MLFIERSCVCIFLCLSYHWHPCRSFDNPWKSAKSRETNKTNIRNNSEISEKPVFLQGTISEQVDDSNETTIFNNRDIHGMNFNFMADHASTEINPQQASTRTPFNSWMFDVAGGPEDPFCFFNDKDKKYPSMSNISACDIDLAHTYKLNVSEWSCTGRCHSNQTTFNESRVTCFCDSLCLLYNSCCEDFQTECQKVGDVARRNREAFENTPAVCSPFVRAQLISKCPKNYPDPVTKQNCESVQNENTLEFIFPVTDSSSGHHFKNRACWQCWSMPGDALAWKVDVAIPKQSWSDNQYDPNTVLSRIRNEPRRAHWTPPDGYHAYYCDSCAVTSCTGCRDEYLQSLCSGLFSSVEVDGVTYKNKYCYTCSEEFVSVVGSDDDVESKYEVPQIPGRWRDPNFGYNYFEFNVIAILRGDIMTIEVVKPHGVSFDWTRVECQSGKPNCVASACFGPFVKSNEICNSSLYYGTVQTTICLSVDADPLKSCEVTENNKLASIDFLRSFKEKVKMYFERGLGYQNVEVLKIKIDEAIQVDLPTLEVDLPTLQVEFAGNMTLTTNPLLVSRIMFLAASDVYAAFTQYKNALMCFDLFVGIGTDTINLSTPPVNCHPLFAVSKSHSQFYTGSFLFVLATVAIFQKIVNNIMLRE